VNGENDTQREKGYVAADLAAYLADRESSYQQLHPWALTQFNDGTYEATCAAIRKAKEKWMSAVIAEEASYPNLSGGVWEILNLAAEGHTAQKESVRISQASFRLPEIGWRWIRV
jgi:hypothetical protein